MAKKVIWTLQARARYKQIIDFLLINWSEKQAIEFTQIVDRKLFILSRFPSMGIRSGKEPKLRKLLITKHNRLLYEIHGAKIYLLDIHDTRQEGEN
jgi:plasmid stabilization system protein ParE